MRILKVTGKQIELRDEVLTKHGWMYITNIEQTAEHLVLTTPQTTIIVGFGQEGLVRRKYTTPNGKYRY